MEHGLIPGQEIKIPHAMWPKTEQNKTTTTTTTTKTEDSAKTLKIRGTV